MRVDSPSVLILLASFIGLAAAVPAQVDSIAVREATPEPDFPHAVVVVACVTKPTVGYLPCSGFQPKTPKTPPTEPRSDLPHCSIRSDSYTDLSRSPSCPKKQ